MAYCKTIICLANALLEGGRSIAGKTPEGGWVRPVSGRPSGQFLPGEYGYAAGAAPRLLDLVSIPFDRPEPDGPQRENHVVSLKPWMPSGALAYEDLSAFVDNPPALWRIPCDGLSESKDVVSSDAANAFDHSLLLIKPESLQIRVGVEGVYSRKLVVRSFFVYADTEYCLPVADSLAQIAFLEKGLGHYMLDAHLCIGLNQPSLADGFYRKVTLGVISRDPF